MPNINGRHVMRQESSCRIIAILRPDGHANSEPIGQNEHRMVQTVLIRKSMGDHDQGAVGGGTTS